MIRKAYIKTGLLLVILFTCDLIYSQTLVGKFSAEVTGGPVFAVGETGGNRLKYGRGLDAVLAVNVFANTGLFGGWSVNSYTSDGVFSYRESGLIYGLQFTINPKESIYKIVIRGGGFWSNLDITGSDNTYAAGYSFNSDWKNGALLSAMLLRSLGKEWYISGKFDYRLSISRVILPEIIWSDGTSESQTYVLMPRNLYLNQAGIKFGIVKTF